MEHVTTASAGYLHTAVITDNGEIWAFGRNNRGELGDGTTIDSSLPILILV